MSGAIASRRQINKLIEYAKTDAGKAKSRLGVSDTLRHEVAEDFVETEVGFQYSFRIISMQNRGIIPNYEASTAKMFMSELGQRLARTGTKVFGLHANIWNENDERAPMNAQFTRAYVLSVPSTIAGGTSEIQRNIIATRGLGLPRG
ncbi:MAG: acyl-CoA dehydrogenase family protein [Dehalococcoidia bacterium]